MNHCTNCGAALEPGAAFCAHCGSSVGGAGGGYGRGERQASTFMNIARGAKGLALLGFLLPWVTVSCANQPLLRASGLDLMTGNARPVEQPAMRGAGGDGGLGELMPSSSQVDVFIIAAAILIVLGLVLSFVLARRKGALAGMIASAAAALVIIYEVLIRLKGAVAAAIQENAANSAGATKGPPGLGEPDMEQLARMISVDPGVGFWVTLFALVAAAILFAMVFASADRKRPGPTY